MADQLGTAGRRGKARRARDVNLAPMRDRAFARCRRHRSGRNAIMKNSQHQIITTHAGSLPRPDDLIELTRARQEGETKDEAGYQARLAAAVQDVVRRQRECGIDVAGRRRIRQGAWARRSITARGGAIRSSASAGCARRVHVPHAAAAPEGRTRSILTAFPGSPRPQLVSRRLCRSGFRRVVQPRRAGHAAAGVRR